MAEIQSNIIVNVETAGALANLKALQGQISAFHTSMAKGGAATAAASSAMQSNLINSINATGKFAASMQTVKTSTESFTHALEANKLSMGEYFRYAGASSKTFGKLFANEFATINKVARERVKDLQSQYIKMGRDANGAMQAIRVRPLSLDMNDLATKTAIAAQKQQILNQLLKQGSTNLLNFGKNTQWAGRQLMVGFTVPLMMLGSVAGKAYMDLEKASIKLRRVYGDIKTTEEETFKIAENVKQIGQEFTKYGITVAETMDLAAKIAVMGKTGSDLLMQVRETQRLVALGGITQDEALKTTTSLTNAFGTSINDLADNVNFLNYTQNQTVFSIEDMATAIPKAGPVVKQLGGDVKDLAFFLTAMKEGGINASEGANALKSGLASIINPSHKASEFLKGFGINLKGIVDADKGNLKKTVIDFASSLDKLDPLNRARAIEMLFGKFQFARMSTLLQNVTKSNSQAATVLNIAQKSKEELSVLAERELKRVSDSPMYKFKKAVADLQLTLVPLGEQFIKAVIPIAKFFTDVLKNFNKMDDGMKSFLTNISLWVAGVGPIILMVIGLFANGIANIIKLFANVKSFINRISSNSKVLGEQVQYLTEEQIHAKSVAASLDQVHANLVQTFTSEKSAVDQLTAAYVRSVEAQRAFSTPIVGRGPVVRAAKGIIMGPGTGTSDSIPAMLSNGEAVIPAASVKKYPGMVAGLVAGNIPGFSSGIAGLGITSGGNTQFTKTNAIQMGHLGEAQRMTIREITAELEKVSILSEQELLQIKANYARLEQQLMERLNLTRQQAQNYKLRAYNEEVYWQSPAANNRGISGARPIDPMREAQYYRMAGSQAGSNYIRHMSMAGMNDAEINATMEKVNSIVISKLEELPKGVTIIGEQLDKIILGAVEEATVGNKAVQKVIMDTKKMFLTVADPFAANTISGTRLKLGPQSYANNASRLAGFTAAERVSGAPLAFSLKGQVPINEAQIAAQGIEHSTRAIKTAMLMLRDAGGEFTLAADEYAGLISKGGNNINQAIELIDMKLMQLENQAPVLYNALKASYGINSPSKVEESIAASRVEGTIKGAEESLPKIVTTGEQMGASFLKPIQEAAATAKVVTSSMLMNPIVSSQLMAGNLTSVLTNKNARIVRGAVGSPFANYSGGMFQGGIAQEIAASQMQRQTIYATTDATILGKAKAWGIKMREIFEGMFNSSEKRAERSRQKQLMLVEAEYALTVAQDKESAAKQRLLTAIEADTLGSSAQTVAAREAAEAEYLLAKEESIAASERLAAVQKTKVGKTGVMGGRMGAGMALSMVPMAMQMSGNEQVKQAGDSLMMPLMGASMALMMFPGTVGIVIAALLAAVGVISMFADAASKAAEKAASLEKSMGAGADAMSKYAEFAKNATASQIMDKRRSDQMSLFGGSSKKETFGDLYLKSETGKAQLTDIASYTSQYGSTSAAQKLATQLQNAVISRAISPTEARSIADSIGKSLKDQNISVDVTAQLIDIFGPDGQSYKDKPFEIIAKIAKDTSSGMQKQINNVEFSKFKQSENIQKAGSQWDFFTAVPQAAAANASFAQNLLSSNQQSLDAMDLQYEEQKKNIQEDSKLKDAERVQRLKDLQSSYQINRSSLLGTYSGNIGSIMQQYKNDTTANILAQTTYDNNVRDAITNRYKDTPEADRAKQFVSTSTNLGGTGDQRYLLQSMVGSGQLSLTGGERFGNIFGKNTSSMNQGINFTKKFGSGMTEQALGAASLLEGASQKKFMVKLGLETPIGAKKVLDDLGKLQKLGGVMDIKAFIQMQADDPKQFKNVQKTLDAIDNLSNSKKKLTVDLILNEMKKSSGLTDAQRKVLGQALKDPKFKNYKKEQRIDYVTTVTAALESPTIASDLRDWATKKGYIPAGVPQAVADSIAAGHTAEYIEELGNTQVSANTTAGNYDTKGGGGGGGGGGTGPTRSDVISAGLALIGHKEDEINKKYDERVKALTKVNDLQKQIAQQTQDQMDIADALAQGDIAAAARAQDKMKASMAQAQFDKQQQDLQDQRDAELAKQGVKIGGKWYTRADLEAMQTRDDIRANRKTIKGQKLKASGGLMSQYFAEGGMPSFVAVGSDTVPAMLTPGEFVVSKPAVNKFGVDNLKSINNGTYTSGDSVYNYNVSVSVNSSNADANDIANVVLDKIKALDSQRIRGNAF